MSGLAMAEALAHLLEFNPNHDDAGRFTTASGNTTGLPAEPSAAAVEITDYALAHGGASVKITKGGKKHIPKTGYMLGVKGHSRVIKIKGRSRRDIARELTYYRKKEAAALDEPDAYTGLWIDKSGPDDPGTLYFDVSVRVGSKSEAIARAYETGELAVWDVAKGLTGADGTIVTQGPEAAAIAQKVRGKKARVKEGLARRLAGLREGWYEDDTDQQAVLAARRRRAVRRGLRGGRDGVADRRGNRRR